MMGWDWERVQHRPRFNELDGGEMEMVIIREVFPRVDLIISGRDKMLSRRCYLNLLGDNLRVPYTVNEIPSECTRAVSMGLGG